MSLASELGQDGPRLKFEHKKADRAWLNGTPCTTRTRDTQGRNLVLCPLS
jgi:hypothetical protein